MSAYRLRGLIELNGIHVNKAHSKTRMGNQRIQLKSDLFGWGVFKRNKGGSRRAKKKIVIHARLPGYPQESFQLANRVRFLSSLQDQQSPISRYSSPTKLHAPAQLSVDVSLYSIDACLIQAKCSLCIGILCNLSSTAPLGDIHIRLSHINWSGLDLRAETPWRIGCTVLCTMPAQSRDRCLKATSPDPWSLQHLYWHSQATLQSRCQSRRSQPS